MLVHVGTKSIFVVSYGILKQEVTVIKILKSITGKLFFSEELFELDALKESEKNLLAEIEEFKDEDRKLSLETIVELGIDELISDIDNKKKFITALKNNPGIPFLNPSEYGIVYDSVFRELGKNLLRKFKDANGF